MACFTKNYAFPYSTQYFIVFQLCFITKVQHKINTVCTKLKYVL